MIERTLIELLGQLKAVKRTERSMGFRNIDSVIQTERIQVFLTQNSRKKSNSVCWDSLFAHLQSAIEVEASGKMTIKFTNEVPETVAIFMKVSRGHVKTSTLASAVINVLSSNDMTRAFGRCYMEVALCYLLERPSYRAEITSEQWSSLIKICLKQFHNPPSPAVPNLKYLELLAKMVTSGVKHLLDPRDLHPLLPFLEKVVEALAGPTAQVHWHLIQLINATMVALAADARFAVAAFIQTVAPTIIGKYRPGRDDNGSVFEFLHISLNIHQPNGVNEDNELAYAQDWSKWKYLLNDMVDVCETEIIHALRAGRDSQPSRHFLRLLADVTALVRDNACDQEERPASPTPRPLTLSLKRKSVDSTQMTQTQKRARTVRITSNLSTVLADASPKDRWFWLQLLEVVIERHPTKVLGDYQGIASSICSFFSDARALDALPSLSRCIVQLLSKFPQVLEDPSSKKMALDSYGKLLDCLLRLIRKDNLPEHHLILQALVRHGIVGDYGPVLELFGLDGIVPTVQGAVTVQDIISAGGVKSEKQRLEILAWVAQERDIFTAQLGLSLTLKNYLIPDLHKPKEIDDLNFVEMYKLIVLKTDIGHTIQLPEDKTEGSVYVFENVLNRILEITETRFNDAVEELAGDTMNLNTMIDTVKLLKFVLITLNELWETPRLLCKNDMVYFARQLLSKLITPIAKALGTEDALPLEALTGVLSQELHPKLQKVLRDAISLDVIQAFFQYLQENVGSKIPSHEGYVPEFLRYRSDFSHLPPLMNEESDISKMFGDSTFRNHGNWSAVEVADFLSQYLCLSTAENCDGILDDVLRFLLDEADDANSSISIKLVLRVTHNLCSSQLNSRQVTDIVGIFLRICLARPMDTALHTVLLASLSKVLPRIGAQITGAASENLLLILGGFRNVLREKDRRPVQMVIGFIRTLVEICHFPALAQMNWPDSDDAVVLDVVKFISHESVCVRGVAAQALQHLFKVKTDDSGWENFVVGRIKEEIDFELEEDLYARKAVTATSLIALTNALAMTSSKRLKVAYFIVQLVQTKSCDIEIVENLLQNISAMLGVKDGSMYFARHLKELLMQFLRGGSDLQQFPHFLLRCKTLRDFLSKYLAVIACSCYLLDKEVELRLIMNAMNVTSSQLLENALPLLLPSATTQMIEEISRAIGPDKECELYEKRPQDFIVAVYREAKTPSQGFLQHAFGSASIVQKVLLSLEEDIVESVTPEDRLAAYKNYQSFTSRFLQCRSEANDIATRAYVVRDAVSVSLRILSEHNSTEMVNKTCDLLRDVITASLSSPTSQMAEILPAIVNGLVSVSSASVSSPALDLLRYLINDCGLGQEIARLDPFPDDVQFSDLMVNDCSYSLPQEMERVVAMSGYTGRRVGGLTRLLRALESQKHDLRLMFEEARAAGWQSRFGKLLHSVVFQLVELCSNCDNAIRKEAAKCLGEFGPTDLSTLVTEAVSNEETVQSVELRVVDSLSVIIKQLIETEPLPVKRSACNAMYALMQCQGGSSQCSAFFLPFLSSQVGSMRVCAKTDEAPALSYWLPSSPLDHDIWISRVTTALLRALDDDIGVISALIDVCAQHPQTAHKVFPIVLELTVHSASQVLKEQISSRISRTLEGYLKGESGLSTRSIRCLVEAVDSIRRWQFKSGTYSSVLDINHLLFAEAAGKCGAHFVSILYGEFWFDEKKSASFLEDPGAWTFSMDDVKEGGDGLSRIIRSALVNVGCPDGLAGCGMRHLTNQTQRVAHMEQIGRWDMALVAHDVKRNRTGVARSLQHLGLLDAMTQMPMTDSDTLLSCAAMLGDWSVVPSAEQPSSFNLHRFNALKSLHEHDTSVAVVELTQACDVVLNHIADTKAESSRDLYRALSQLQCLKDVSDIVNVKSGADIEKLSKKWKIQDKLEPYEFSLKEQVLTVRCAAVKEQVTSDSCQEWKDELVRQYLRLSKLARKAKRTDVVLRNTMKIMELENVSEDVLAMAKVEEARYYWLQGELKTAIFLLHKVLQSLEGKESKELISKCLRLYGTWIVETKTENPREIIQKYFMKSQNLANNMENKMATWAVVAKFADAQFVQRKEYFESQEYGMRRNSMRQRVRQLENNENQAPRDQAMLKVISMQKREALKDERELESLEKDLYFFHSLTITSYLITLRYGDKFDHFVFRLVSLWLNCVDKGTLEDLLNKHLEEIPSYKFLTLLPQIVPRMHEDRKLKEVVERAIVEHPHHTLPSLFALKNAQADYKYTTSLESPHPSIRIITAATLLKKVEDIPSMRSLITQMGTFTDGLIHIANVVTAKKQPFVDIPPDFPISAIVNLDQVLMPSITLPVRRNQNYSDIVGIHKFGSRFDLVGGINAPKKLVCFGTDGQQRTLLVKGQDDPRQDAVMQQVFGVINDVLRRDEAAARRQLAMRTYRVVPLSHRSGIIQWCEDTQPIGQYLVGDGPRGAHCRFRPNDMKPQEARARLMAAAKLPLEEKLGCFLNVCRQLKPVLHYFFLEKFPAAGLTFEKRLAYIRSVATSSMIGYVLGLGDRHVANILIDNKSAEVIHIDFGIAFDAAKLLPTPETVPFRLTRDIIDGMGMCGLDGVFRASCEQTMTVLRANKDVIITLLEVLLHDPLYNWSIRPNDESGLLSNDVSPPKTDDEVSAVKVNPSAQLALQNVTRKLQGMEQGGVVITVEGQVNGLLQQAQDPSNLCALYSGWQAYL